MHLNRKEKVRLKILEQKDRIQFQLGRELLMEVEGKDVLAAYISYVDENGGCNSKNHSLFLAEVRLWAEKSGFLVVVHAPQNSSVWALLVVPLFELTSKLIKSTNNMKEKNKVRKS